MFMQEEAVFGLFYDANKNMFTDEDGFVICSIFDYVTPNDLVLFRFYKDYMIVRHRTMKNVLCELFYPEDGDEED